MQVAVEFDWTLIGTVTRTPAGRLSIPATPAAPGVYRFQMTTASGTEAYIGESQNLHFRMSRNYATTHTGSTNVRIREWLLGHLNAGQDIAILIATTARLAIDGAWVDADLSQKHIRLLVENAALAGAYAQGEIVSNA